MGYVEAINAGLHEERMNQKPEKNEAFEVGSWVYSQEFGEPLRVLETQTVWNHTTYQVWQPSSESVTWVTTTSGDNSTKWCVRWIP